MAGNRTAVIVVDMLNPYEHDDADRLVESVADVIEPIAGLIERASSEGVELIYVNDNHGDWNSSQEELAEAALKGRRPDLVKPILPPGEADFVLKARHTIFYMTPLEYLLSQREIGHLVLAGQVTEQCILYSALDAYVRHLDVSVPTDGVAHIYEDLAQAALKMMERNMRAELVLAADCRLEA
jgi:nicotinamidase-related amidase